MAAKTERHMVAGVGAPDIEAIRIDEIVRVSIGGANHALNDLPVANRDIAQRDGARRITRTGLDGWLPT